MGLRVDAAVHSDAPGSMLGALTYHHGGWTATAWTGAAAGAVLLLMQATEPRGVALVEAGR